MKMIKEWQSIFTIAELCSIFNISRATYYRWKKQEKTVTNHEEKTIIGVASGKCGFTTLSPFSRRFPQF
ncbi:helix-turn-helix domain-containing protein [Bacillus cereus]|uniref:helix-turn-helix domain-containing protein n=1 Tax=Bacillus cereus TaxID=1396 RepID=UPI003A93C930